MVAVDIPAILLVIGILVLCATTAVTALRLPSIEWPTRHRGRRAPGPRSFDVAGPVAEPIIARRVVTGRSAQLPQGTPNLTAPAIELPPAPARQRPISTDSPREHGDEPSTGAPDDVDAAEAFILRLVDEDPQRLAELMTDWMRADRDLRARKEQR